MSTGTESDLPKGVEAGKPGIFYVQNMPTFSLFGILFVVIAIFFPATVLSLEVTARSIVLASLVSILFFMAAGYANFNRQYHASFVHFDFESFECKARCGPLVSLCCHAQVVLDPRNCDLQLHKTGWRAMCGGEASNIFNVVLVPSDTQKEVAPFVLAQLLGEDENTVNPEFQGWRKFMAKNGSIKNSTAIMNGSDKKRPMYQPAGEHHGASVEMK